MDADQLRSALLHGFSGTFNSETLAAMDAKELTEALWARHPLGLTEQDIAGMQPDRLRITLRTLDEQEWTDERLSSMSVKELRSALRKRREGGYTVADLDKMTLPQLQAAIASTCPGVFAASDLEDMDEGQLRAQFSKLPKRQECKHESEEDGIVAPEWDTIGHLAAAGESDEIQLVLESGDPVDQNQIQIWVGCMHCTAAGDFVPEGVFQELEVDVSRLSKSISSKDTSNRRYSMPMAQLRSQLVWILGQDHELDKNSKLILSVQPAPLATSAHDVGLWAADRQTNAVALLAGENAELTYGSVCWLSSGPLPIHLHRLDSTTMSDSDLRKALVARCGAPGVPCSDEDLADMSTTELRSALNFATSPFSSQQQLEGLTRPQLQFELVRHQHQDVAQLSDERIAAMGADELRELLLSDSEGVWTKAQLDGMELHNLRLSIRNTRESHARQIEQIRAVMRKQQPAYRRTPKAARQRAVKTMESLPSGPTVSRSGRAGSDSKKQSKKSKPRSVRITASASASTEDGAALKMQRMYRGYRVRSRANAKRMSSHQNANRKRENARKTPSHPKTHSYSVQNYGSTDTRHTAALAIQKTFRGSTVRRKKRKASKRDHPRRPKQNVSQPHLKSWLGLKTGGMTRRRSQSRRSSGSRGRMQTKLRKSQRIHIHSPTEDTAKWSDAGADPQHASASARMHSQVWRPGQEQVVDTDVARPSSAAGDFTIDTIDTNTTSNSQPGIQLRVLQMPFRRRYPALGFVQYDTSDLGVGYDCRNTTTPRKHYDNDRGIGVEAGADRGKFNGHHASSRGFGADAWSSVDERALLAATAALGPRAQTSPVSRRNPGPGNQSPRLSESTQRELAGVGQERHPLSDLEAMPRVLTVGDAPRITGNTTQQTGSQIFIFENGCVYITYV